MVSEESDDMFNIKNKKSVYEFTIVIIASMIIFGVLLFISGSAFSGYHLIDDHDIIQICSGIRGLSFEEFLKYIWDYNMGWMSSRFRPLYSVDVCVFSALVGTEFNIWMMRVAVEGMVTFVILYYIARNLNCDCFVSFIFSATILFGKQFSPWYRSINQENAGMLYCSLTFLLIILLLKRGNKDSVFSSVPYRVICIFIGCLTSLQKESFTMMLPAFLLFIAAYSIEIAGIPFLMAVKEYLDFIIVYTVVFIINISIIVFYVGTSKTSYAGFETETSLFDYYGMVLTNLRNVRYTKIAYAALILLFALYAERGVIKEKVLGNIWKILFTVYVFFSQQLLHAKSGMWERYLLPYLFGMAFFFILFTMKEFKSNKVIYSVYAFVIVISLLMGIRESWRGARSWKNDGDTYKQFLSIVSDRISSNEEMKIYSNMPGTEEIDSAVEIWERQFHKGFQFDHKYDEAVLNQDIIDSGDYDMILCGTDLYDQYDFSDYNTEFVRSYAISVRNDSITGD